MGHRRFWSGPQSYSKIDCLSQKSLISVIQYLLENWQKSRTPMCWPFFWRSRQKSLSQRWRPFFFVEIGAKIALQGVKTVFLFSFFEIRAITGQTTLTRKWRPFFRDGGPQSYGLTAVVLRAMGHANFQKTQNGPRFQKGWEPLS